MKREAIASVIVVFALLVSASIARARLERAGGELALERTAQQIADSTRAQIRGLEEVVLAERQRIEFVGSIPHALAPGVAMATVLAIAPEGVVLDRFALDSLDDERSDERSGSAFEAAIDGFAAEASLIDAYAEAVRSSGLTERVIVHRIGERTLRGRPAFDFALRFEIPLDGAFELVVTADDLECMDVMHE